MNYKFKCKECGNDVLEEVMTDVFQYSNIEDIQIVNGELYFKYGNTFTERGETCVYTCNNCGTDITEKELRKLAVKS